MIEVKVFKKYGDINTWDVSKINDTKNKSNV
jgi:hypothetical protein